ncbi:hypothetical protein MASR2M44_22160 [Bacteroidota bacterium]
MISILENSINLEISQIPKGFKVYRNSILENMFDPEGVAEKRDGNLFYKPVTLSGSRRNTG